MATVDECEAALGQLAARLATYRDSLGDDGRTPDRTVSCRITDLDAVFAGRLENGRLVGIELDTSPKAGADAQIRFEMAGDDLLGLVDGTVDVAGAWLGGRLKVSAGFRDLIRLRSFL